MHRLSQGWLWTPLTLSDPVLLRSTIVKWVQAGNYNAILNGSQATPFEAVVRTQCISLFGARERHRLRVEPGTHMASAFFNLGLCVDSFPSLPHSPAFGSS